MSELSPDEHFTGKDIVEDFNNIVYYISIILKFTPGELKDYFSCFSVLCESSCDLVDTTCISKPMISPLQCVLFVGLLYLQTL